eukprot:6191498-Pleurochrysis_carterae.AAC.1
MLANGAVLCPPHEHESCSSQRVTCRSAIQSAVRFSTRRRNTSVVCMDRAYVSEDCHTYQHCHIRLMICTGFGAYPFLALVAIVCGVLSMAGFFYAMREDVIRGSVSALQRKCSLLSV